MLQVLIDTINRFNNQGESFNTHLLNTATLFDNSRELYITKYDVMTGAVGAVVGGAVGNTFNRYILGALVGIIMINLSTFRMSCSMHQAKTILKKACVGNKKRNCTDNDSVYTMAGLVGRLQFDLLACKNHRTKAESGIKVRNRADKMLADICELQAELDAMKKKSTSK